MCLLALLEMEKTLWISQGVLGDFGSRGLTDCSCIRAIIGVYIYPGMYVECILCTYVTTACMWPCGSASEASRNHKMGINSTYTIDDSGK